MISPSGFRPCANSSVGTTGNRIAKLAQLHLRLSACEEQLGALERGCASTEIKARDKQLLTSKIADIKAQITELARSDASPVARAAEEDANRQHTGAHSAERTPLDAVRLALVKEGHLGTLANVRA